MSRMKHIYHDIVSNMAWGNPNPSLPLRKPSAPADAQNNSKPITQVLWVLCCNDKPVGAYTSRDVAEYEMWLCAKGEEYMHVETPSTYTLHSVSVCTDLTPFTPEAAARAAK